MTVVAELVGKLGFEADDKELKSFQKGLDDVKAGMLGLAATLGATGLAIYSFIKLSADAADATVKLSKQAGISTDELQRFGFAAEQNGSSVEEFANSMKFLSKNLIDAEEEGSAMEKAFKKIGINTIDPLTGKTKKATDVFLELSDFFAKTEDGALKTATALELLGRSGVASIELLELGSEAINALIADGRLVIISPDELKKLKDFNDGFTALGGQIRGFIAQVSAQLAPGITEAVKEFSIFLAQNKEFLQAVGSTVLGGFVNFFIKLIELSQRLFQLFKPLVEIMIKIPGLTEAILTVLTLLSGAAIVKGLVAVGLAMKGIALSAIAASAPFLLWAAAIAAVLLLLDDLVAWYNDEGSFFGDLFNSKGIFEQTPTEKKAKGAYSSQDALASFRESRVQNNNNQMKLEPNVTVNVGENANPAQIAGAVSEGITNSFENQLKSSGLQFSTKRF